MSDLVDGLRRCANALYLNLPESVADDVQKRIQEAVDEIERLRDQNETLKKSLAAEVQGELEAKDAEIERLTRERDEARDAARTLLFAVEQYDGAPRPHMVVDHPWLKEREGEG